MSDTHFGIGPMTAARKQVWADDLAYIRRTGLVVRGHIVMGDITNDAGGAGGWTGPSPYIGVQDLEAIAFYNANMSEVPFYFVNGNHDMGNDVNGTLRDPDVTAHAQGMPGRNFVVDMDVLRFIFVSPPGIQGNGQPVPLSSGDIAWIAAQAAASTLPCAIVCHYALKDTVQDSGNIQNYLSPAVDIATMMASTPQIVAWISGHTHRSLDNNIYTTATYGSHKIACVDASGICYTIPEGSTFYFARICSLYLNVIENRLEFRYRDHGAGTWVPAGPLLHEQKRVFSFDF